MPDTQTRSASRIVAIVLALVVVAGSGALVFALLLRGDGGTTLSPSGGSSDQPETRTLSELMEQVSDIRGLAWQDELPVRVVDADEMSQRVRDLVATERAKHPEDLPNAETILKLLQLVPDDLDYESTIDRLVEGSVLGYYDDETREIFVRGTDTADLDLPTQSTMVHELTHALTDQHFDFGTLDRELVDEDRYEESFALSALIEGDAELVTDLWSSANLTDRQRLAAEPGADVDPSIYADVPRYVLDSLLFPYLSGLDFVSDLHAEGGFAAIDAAYGEPPDSTEEILDPELYDPGSKWTSPELPDLAAATGCDDVDSGAVGVYDMFQVLRQHIPAQVAREASAGWDGDAYVLLRCGSSVGMVDRWQGDSASDLDELASSLERWAEGWSGSADPPDEEGEFAGPDGAGRIVRTGDTVDLVIADDAPTAERISAALLGA